MKFCSNCGSDQLMYEIPAGDTRERFFCHNCHIIHYINPKIVIGCFILHDNKILLAKRGIQPQLGKWNIPQGFMEMDETIEEGAKRETYEEIGVLPDIIKLITVYSVPHANQVHMHFLASISSTDFKITEESTDIRLFSSQDIPWEEIAFSSNRFTIESYLKEGTEKIFVGRRTYP